MNQNVDQYKKTETTAEKPEAIDAEIDKIQEENINTICQLIESINELEKIANDGPQDNKKRIQTSIVNIRNTVSGFNVDSMDLIASDKDKAITTNNKDNQIIYTDAEAYKKAKEEYENIYKQYSTDIELYNKYNKEAWNSYLSFFVRDGFFYNNGFTPGFVNHILTQNKEIIHIAAIVYDGYNVKKMGTGLLYTKTSMSRSKITKEFSQYAKNIESITKTFKLPELIKILNLCIEQYKQLGMNVYGFRCVMGSNTEVNEDPIGNCILYIPQFTEPVEPKVPVFKPENLIITPIPKITIQVKQDIPIFKQIPQIPKNKIEIPIQEKKTQEKDEEGIIETKYIPISVAATNFRQSKDINTPMGYLKLYNTQGHYEERILTIKEFMKLPKETQNKYVPGAEARREIIQNVLSDTKNTK